MQRLGGGTHHCALFVGRTEGAGGRDMHGQEGPSMGRCFFERGRGRGSRPPLSVLRIWGTAVEQPIRPGCARNVGREKYIRGAGQRGTVHTTTSSEPEAGGSELSGLHVLCADLSCGRRTRDGRASQTPAQRADGRAGGYRRSGNRLARAPRTVCRDITDVHRVGSCSDVRHSLSGGHTLRGRP